MLRRVCIVLFTLFFAASVNAMTSTNYTIDWDSVNSGGDDISSSTNYQILDTIGEQGTGTSTSANYSLRAGYRHADTPKTILTFNIGTQENSTKVRYGTFNNPGLTVNVSSTAGYSANDYIVVVENEGASQIVAVGKISSLNGNDIIVDEWSGSHASLSAIPGGQNDYVYRLGGSVAQLGTLNLGSVGTAVTFTDVLTNSETGYTVHVNTDGQLRKTNGNFIQGVSDGTVTGGEGEYGGRIYGTNATSTGSDFALITTLRSIQQSSTFADNERTALIYKVSMKADSVPGDYSQQVYYTVTVNF